MLNLYWGSANPHINLDVVICCAGAIVGLFEFAEDREVNNLALLGDHRSIAGRDEALTELGYARRSGKEVWFPRARSAQPRHVPDGGR